MFFAEISSDFLLNKLHSLEIQSKTPAKEAIRYGFCPLIFANLRE